MNQSFQDQGSILHCYGCGKNNESGLQLKSFWEADEAVAEFLPKSFHCGGLPEIVYGGLIASLIDCHSCNLAVANAYRQEQRNIGSEPLISCVTAQLNVSLLKPTPIGKTMILRARIREIEKNKIWVDCEVHSEAEITSKGEVLVIRIAEHASSGTVE
tara:strand:- start:105 stop:578 length:474 start_codon:yes stop_codon:yes gene_type:complete